MPIQKGHDFLFDPGSQGLVQLRLRHDPYSFR